MNEVNIEDLPEGRVNEISVRVVRVSKYTKERRDDELTVETPDGSTLQLIIWSKHDIDWEWTRNGRYRLHDVLHKIWESDGEHRHLLSSTDDMSIDTIALPSDNSKSAGTSSGGILNPKRANEDIWSEEELVDRLLDDLDFEGES